MSRVRATIIIVTECLIRWPRSLAGDRRGRSRQADADSEIPSALRDDHCSCSFQLYVIIMIIKSAIKAFSKLMDIIFSYIALTLIMLQQLCGWTERTHT